VCVEAEYFAAAPGTNKHFHQTHHSKHCLKASLLPKHPVSQRLDAYSTACIRNFFCITKTDAARPHRQRGTHRTHAQQLGHAHQQWHPDHSDHSRPSLIQNHHSQKYNILSQQLHEKTQGQVESSLDELRCKGYGPTVRQYS
jgi:hypothetical protein